MEDRRRGLEHPPNGPLNGCAPPRGLNRDRPSPATYPGFTATFQIVSGVALYKGTNDVRWLYVACFCPACGLMGVYADWKCEGGDADAFLART